MPAPFICNRGHRWEPQDTATSPTNCPVCGSSAAPCSSTLTQEAIPEDGDQATPSAAATLPVAGLTATHPELLPQLPGYEVQRLLGEGGMGFVVLARHLQLDRLVAIKLPLHTLSEGGRARFLREARAAAGLRHPNICPVHEVGEHQGRPYLVMDYIDGPTLCGWVGQKPTARRCAEVAALLARAVAHAHAHGVIHRDLKPTNILIERNTGQPVLTDFGLAKLLDEAGDQLSQSGTVQGTPAYMSPEQAAGNSTRIGQLSDVYSLGANLYELLTGRPPYTGSIGEILKLVQTEDPVPPRRLNPRIHPDLETICLTAMAREPSQRYPSALALAEDLERFAAGETIRARRAGTFRRTLRWVKRHPLPAASACVGLLAVLVAAALMFAVVLQSRQRQELEELRTAFDAELERPEASEAYFERMEGYLGGLQRLSPRQVPELRERMLQRVAGSIRASLEQPRLTPETEEQIRSALAILAARAPEAAEPLEQLLRERQSGWRLMFDLRPPFTDWQEVFSTSLKPQTDRLIRQRGKDGKQPAALVRTREECRGPVRLEAVFDPSWGKARQLGLVLNNVEAASGEVLRLAVAPDGRSFVAACGLTGPPGTSVCELATGRVRHTLEAPGPNSAVAFAPGGQRLALAGTKGSIRLCDLATGQEIVTGDAHEGILRSLAFAPDGRTLASCGEDGSIQLWDVDADGDTLRHRATIPRAHEGRAIADIAFAPDGRTLASAGDDGTVRIWDVTARRVLHLFRGHAGRIHRIAFNPGAGSPVLVSAGEDGTVRLWQTGPDRELAALHGEAGSAHDVAFSPDGKSLAVAYAGKSVKLWDVASRRVRLELTSFTDQVLSVIFTPDGRSVLTGDAARTLRRWDAFTGREPWSLKPSAGYAFVLRPPEGAPGGEADKPPATLGEALSRGQPMRMQILRNGRLQRERTVLLAPGEPLHLRASREGDRLTFQANGQTTLEFQDVFPLGAVRAGVFALEWPVGVGLKQVQAERRALPVSPSLLEQGDEAYARGDFAAASDCYARQMERVSGAASGREPRYKRALCLLALKRPEDALPLLQELARGVTENQRERWGLLAACQLWLHYLQEREFERAEEVFRLLEAHYRFEQLAALISDELRGQILEAYRKGSAGRLIIRRDPRQARHLRRVLDVEVLFKASWQERLRTAHFLCVRYLLDGESDQGVRTAEDQLRDLALPPESSITLIVDLVWALRQRGDNERALAEVNRQLAGREERCPIGLLPLLLEQARLLATRKEWPAAERSVSAFLRQLNPAQWRLGSSLLAQGLLVRGFIREQQGDGRGAQQAWQQALRAIRGTPAFVSCEGFLLASLTNDLTEADVAFFIEQSTRELGIPAATFIRKRSEFDPAWLAGVMRNTWRNPRGRDYARRIAFQDLPYLDLSGIQFALFVAEAFRQGALAGPPDAEQEALIWGISESVYRAYTRGEFSDAQAFLGLMAWLGTTGFTGWGGLSSSLQGRPQLRGPLAYLYGQHYLRLKKPGDARMLFQTALKDAQPGKALHRLTQQALEQMPNRK